VRKGIELKVLIVKLGSIGDVVHAMPAVARLRRALPKARIDWMVERYARGVLAYARNVDHVIEIDTLHWRRSFLRPATWGEIFKNTRELRGTRYDAVLELQGLWKSAFIASLVGARQLVGADRKFLREPGSSIFYSRRVDREPRRESVIFEHIRIVDGFLDSLMASHKLGAFDPTDPSQIEFDELASEADRAWANDRLGQLGFQHFAVIHPGANWKSKLWPAESYVLLVQRIQNELNLPVLMTIGPSEENLVAQLSDRLAANQTVMLSPTLAQLAALSERATVFIGPDTGPLHIAAASGAPIVGIFAPTDPVRNGPFDPEDIVVHHNLCGEYCNRRDCGPLQCIATVTVDAVFEAVKERLRRVPIASIQPSVSSAGA
jgi:heptosyltransferase-1